jgi:Protein of unknown function (DUF3268).
MIIYCTGCEKDVDARLTTGAECYPYRPDLALIPFWRCDTCGNYVGCHYKTRKPTTPLGCIATPEILNARRHIHALLDPLWKSKKISRGEAYGYISGKMKLGRSYHTAEIRSIEEAREVYKVIIGLKKKLEK